MKSKSMANGASKRRANSGTPLNFTRPIYGPGLRNWHKGDGSIAKTNRRTGKPHQHLREIERRLRQQASKS